MDCNQFKSVAVLADSPVRSTHARRSRALLASLSVSAPVSNKLLTDFSICSILGLETAVTQSSAGFECHRVTSAPLSPYSDCTSPRPGHRETSPPLTPYSDPESAISDCSRESDRQSIYSEQLPKKKRQRTTFSRNEVMELEWAFNRRPYLIADDEELLVQRLGITRKSVKYWFQNRRAKSTKLERKLLSVCQTSKSNRVEFPVMAITHRPRRLQLEIPSPSNHWKQAKCISYPYSTAHQYSRPSTTPAGRHSSNKFNLFRGDQSFPFPMYHPDQFKIRLAQPARLANTRVSRRFQPY